MSRQIAAVTAIGEFFIVGLFYIRWGMAASESKQKAAMRKIVAAFWVISQVGLLQSNLGYENRLA
jgi:hypothetical protein